jgi:guanine nucleotide-binding protein subunit alpha
MGCGASKEDNAGKVRNDEIENQLKRDKMAQRNEIKMLLLGQSFHRRFRGSVTDFFRCW